MSDVFDRRLRHGLPRLLRGGFVALLTTTLGVAAHVHAGGHPPTAAAMAGLTAVFALFCWFLSSQRWTARPLLAVFLLAQIATHVVAMVEQPRHAMGGAMMVPSHVVAALLLVVMVTRGEGALVRLLENLALRSVGLRVVAPPRRTSSRVVARVVWPLARRLTQPVRGRAPPRGLLLPAS